MIRTLLIRVCLILGVALGASAQEPLETVLNRGFIAHWLVCGPFKSDLKEGILAAVKKGEAALGTRDYMKSAGGIERLRPEHLMKIKTDDGEAIWQRAGVQDRSLDLSPFFPKASDGVAYAAFYVTAKTERTVYFDLQSPMGLRVWINGFPVRDITAAPLLATGLDRFAVKFKAGVNLAVMEVPGASFESLASAAGIPPQEFAVRGFVNRPLLQAKSGYEIALSIKPLEPLGAAFYIPTLENANTFSGTASAICQDTLLTLFNPSTQTQPAVEIAAIVKDANEPVLVKTGPLLPQSAVQARIPIPVGELSPGQTITTKILLSTKESSGAEIAVSFPGKLVVLSRAEGGKMYVITGPYFQGEGPEDQSREWARRIASFNKQMTITAMEPAYGIDLGPAEQWRAFLVAFPKHREALIPAIRPGRCAAEAGYSHVDERMVSGETLARNLVYGLTMSQSLLEDHSQGYFSWNGGGIAPQTPQLLADAGISGLVSNLPVAGLPCLFRQEALEGSVILHRRKQASTGPGTADELRQMVSLQRREIFEQGISTDILVINNRSIPPEPFFLGSSSEFARSFPAIIVQGGGGRAFVEDIGTLPKDVGGKIPFCTRMMNTGRLGEVLAQPDIKRAYSVVESRLLAAEKYATLASLLGAEYPDIALDYAWRQMLYWSAPDRLGLVKHEHTYVDALSGLHGALDLVTEVTQKAAGYIAQEADTMSNAPNESKGVAALTILNSCSWRRTEPCVADITVENAKGITLYDEQGLAIPFTADNVQNEGKVGIKGARIRFVAGDIPSLGYKTYYVSPQGKIPNVLKSEDPQIENDLLLVIIDEQTGNIKSMVDKRSGTEYAVGPLNQVLLLGVDAPSADSGSELAASGEKTSPSDGAEIQTEVSEFCQRITITNPLGGGKVHRILALYRGIPRVDCETRLEGVALENKMAVVTFDAPSENRAPVYGERFGAVVGKTSQGSLDYRCAGRENLSGTAAYPALQWASIGPGDQVQIGGEGSVTLRPAMIVYGKDLVFEKAARDIQSALIQRGIPSTLCVDQGEKPGYLWSDSTEFYAPDAEVAYGQVFYISVGSPEQNTFSRDMIKKLPEDRITAYRERLEQGTALFMESGPLSSGTSSAPVLILSGLLSDKTVELARDFAESVRVRGNYSLPPAMFMLEKAQSRPETGFAVLFSGTRLFSFEKDGRLVMGLGQYVKSDVFSELPSPSTELQTFSYALYPYTGTWRDADIAIHAMGYSERMTTVQTGLHAGHQPNPHSFFSFNQPHLAVAALKPLGDIRASLSGQASEPRSGIAARLVETTGTPWEGDMRCFTDVRDLRMMDLLENPTKSISVEGGVARMKIPGFGVETMSLFPGSRFPHGEREALGRTTDVLGSIHSRYWQHNAGPEAMGGQPLSIVITGTLSENESDLEVVVANHQMDQDVQGLVQVRATDGWSIGPADFYYNVQPGASMTQKVLVMNATGDPSTGGVAVSTEYQGQIYRDVLERMEDSLQMTISRTESQVKVTVNNRSGVPAEGYLDLVTPTVHWIELKDSNPEGQLTTYPRRAGISVAPFKSQEVLFRLSNAANAPWAVAKLAANGKVLYKALQNP